MATAHSYLSIRVMAIRVMAIRVVAVFWTFPEIPGNVAGATPTVPAPSTEDRSGYRSPYGHRHGSDVDRRSNTTLPDAAV